ncbi:transcriptional regulator [Schaalia sp. ZJ405]|uniref:helix-turn-helix transcriptional regulator n=1 Tax=Schaalia sp. ZJ405 TaxID=2709403 RepID=UPI0013EBCF6C|nr:transcriptional regulator [Schaalia sp. ZJ405]QPK81482.1 transcriptional regulator [Schaalia sp. ZJ405]
MTVRYLGISDLAEIAGITVGTAKQYGKEGRLPAPDVLVGLGDRAVRGWKHETVEEWMSNRPGRGRRAH